MMNTVAKTAVVAAALASTASAWRLDFFSNGDCSGAATSGAGSDSTCLEIGTSSSAKVVCATPESTSAWEYELYDGVSDCSGAGEVSFSGTNSDDCVVVSGVSYKVDCGASACYSSTATVTLEGGATVPMSQLNPGDSVLSADAEGNLFFDKVFRVTEWDQDVTASYVRITTESGATLELTPNHYVHAGGLDAASLKPAADVAKGDSLVVVDDEGATSESAVASVEQTTSRGMFNVHTLSGRIVVNGVVASHFSDETTWSGESKFTWAPYWYKLVDVVGSLLGNAENARDN